MNNQCILPWIHLATDTIGTIRPCCLYKNPIKHNGKILNLKTSTLMEAWKSTDLEKLRQDFLHGDRPDGCSQCWAIERAGGQSKRLMNNERFVDYIEESKTLRYLDIKLGTICNLKCRTCSSTNSSRWVTDEIKIYGEVFNNDQGAWVETNDIFWQEFNQLIPTLEFLDFAGGEPFLLDKHFDLLEKCVEQGAAENISIHYNTNGTITITQEMIDLWAHFKWVEIMFSIDAVEEKFEYLRHPGKWNDIKTNFESIINNDRLHTTVCFTFSILNTLYLDELMYWIDSYNKNISLYLNPLHGPKHYNIKSLSKNHKAYITDRLERFGRKETNEVLRFMTSENLYTNYNTLRDITNRLDNIREEKFAKIFPELNELLNNETN